VVPLYRAPHKINIYPLYNSRRHHLNPFDKIASSAASYMYQSLRERIIKSFLSLDQQRVQMKVSAAKIQVINTIPPMTLCRACVILLIPRSELNGARNEQKRAASLITSWSI